MTQKFLTISGNRRWRRMRRAGGISCLQSGMGCKTISDRCTVIDHNDGFGRHLRQNRLPEIPLRHHRVIASLDSLPFVWLQCFPQVHHTISDSHLIEIHRHLHLRFGMRFHMAQIDRITLMHRWSKDNIASAEKVRPRSYDPVYPGIGLNRTMPRFLHITMSGMVNGAQCPAIDYPGIGLNRTTPRFLHITMSGMVNGAQCSAIDYPAIVKTKPILLGRERTIIPFKEAGLIASGDSNLTDREKNGPLKRSDHGSVTVLRYAIRNNDLNIPVARYEHKRQRFLRGFSDSGRCETDMQMVVGNPGEMIRRPAAAGLVTEVFRVKDYLCRREGIGVRLENFRRIAAISVTKNRKTDALHQIGEIVQPGGGGRWIAVHASVAGAGEPPHQVGTQSAGHSSPPAAGPSVTLVAQHFKTVVRADGALTPGWRNTDEKRVLRSGMSASRVFAMPVAHHAGNAPADYIYCRSVRPEPAATENTDDRNKPRHNVPDFDLRPIEQTVEAIVNRSLAQWRKTTLNPKRIADLTCETMAYRLVRERERLGR